MTRTWYGILVIGEQQRNKRIIVKTIKIISTGLNWDNTKKDDKYIDLVELYIDGKHVNIINTFLSKHVVNNTNISFK